MEQAFRHCVHEAHEAGQTVFLSSHVLSDVEALCDRVGILREGRLVEMGTLEEMRHLSTLTVEVTFGGVPPDLADVAGVKRAVVDGRRVHLEVQGPIEPVVDALAGTGVRELLSREPSLEELFLAHTSLAALRRSWPQARPERAGHDRPADQQRRQRRKCTWDSHPQLPPPLCCRRQSGHGSDRYGGQCGSSFGSVMCANDSNR